MVYDVLVKNSRLIDGAGNPWFKADVAIEGERIAKVGRLASAEAGRVIDASGHIVCPGFIDIHNHSDTTILIYPGCESMIMQGVTTLVLGQCGSSAAPIVDIDRQLGPIPAGVTPNWRSFDEYLRSIEKHGVSANIASLVGHSTVRRGVMGMEARLATESELDDMKALVAESMEGGAFGISTGLGYTPGSWSDTNEIIELCKVVAKYGGYYATHIRWQGWKERLAVKEAIEIGKKAGIPVQISHMETHYPEYGKEKWYLRMIEEARAEGHDITTDIPPYLWGATGLRTMIPEKYHEGGQEKMAKRLRDPQIRKQILNDVDEEVRIMPPRSLGADGEWDKLVVTRSENKEFLGKTFAEIAKMRGQEPWDMVFDLLIQRGPQGLIGQYHFEDDIRILVKHHLSMIESDGSAVAPYGPLGKGVSHPHPRCYGVFPMTFRKYVRGETRDEMPQELGAKILTWEEAVRKMTSLPAQRLGLSDRGLVKAGMRADLAVFNPKTITDKATYVDPHQYAEGILYVLVNGQIVVDDGEHTGALPGKALRGPGCTASRQ